MIEMVPIIYKPEIYPRFEGWKRKLLDFSSKNDIINFKESKRILKIKVPGSSELKYISQLEDNLAEGKAYSFISLPEKDEISNENIWKQFKDNILFGHLKQVDLVNRLINIYKLAQRSYEESGASTLFLVLGMLEWYESEDQKNPMISPLIFIPLEIERKGLSDFFIVKGNDETRVNITLINRLWEDFKIEFPLLESNLPNDEHGIDIPNILNDFQGSILKKFPSWKIDYSAYIGHFSYSKFLMWKDLNEINVQKLVKTNNLFATLVDPASHSFSEPEIFPREDNLDTEYPPQDIICPLSADSSQLAAIIAARDGKTFVLHGPPGTGKSQTIANIIAQCLAENRTVLFVSEKRVALNVVHSRLKECGLGCFCLELHSNKSSKREFLDQLSESVNPLKEIRSLKWIEKSQELISVRHDLNQYVKSIHAIQPTGESYFQGISSLCEVRNVEKLSLEWPPFLAFRKKDLDFRKKCIDELKSAVITVGNPRVNPWNPSRFSEWDPEFRNKIEKILKSLLKCIQNIRDSGNYVYKFLYLGFEEQHNVKFSDFIEIINTINLTKYVVSKEALSDPDFEINKDIIIDIFKIGKQRDQLREKIFSKYDPAVLKIDHTNLINSYSEDGLISSFLTNRRVRRELDPFSRVPLGTKEEIITDLYSIQTLSELEMKIEEKRDLFEFYFLDYWNNGNPNWNDLSIIIDLCSFLRKKALLSVKNPKNLPPLFERWSKILKFLLHKIHKSKSIKQKFAEVLESSRIIENQFSKLTSLLQLSSSGLTTQDETHLYIQKLEKKVNVWSQNLPNLRNWCQYQAIRKKCMIIGFKPLIDAIESKDISSDQINDLFKRSYYQWWTEKIQKNDPTISKFFRPNHEEMILQLSKIDDEYRKLSSEQIIDKLYIQNIECQKKFYSELMILNRQIKLKKKNISVRNLILKIPNILPCLKPCFLMSPLSVAQYLSLENKPFDVVIFDEASQIPVWDAIGAISRSNQAIIVGDPKQLPPTNIFERISNSDDGDIDLLLEDLESILDECITSKIPEMHLKWHYRSRHESLIAFSNYHFYNNNLRTFPSPHKDSAVALKKVGGVYDAGKSRTNIIEANAIVEEIIRRLANSESSSESIGVVTFNIPQQDLIYDLLEKAKRDCPHIVTSLSNDKSEPLFIKNLENVQGDERDVILFSVGYGPDHLGKVSLNFGPLNKDGGERRLNVAISRARKQIIVFSSLYPEHINLSLVKGKGVGLLKNFLEYAEHGVSAIFQRYSQTFGEYESPLEEEIGLAIQEMGYTIHPQVGCGGYRIDLGIVDDEYEGKYLLGVECDGAQYHRFQVARDRDRLREEILKGLGWKIHRIWSTDWWNDKNAEINRLKEAIDHAKKNK